MVELSGEDAMLLGTGMAAASAAGLYPSLLAAAVAMQPEQAEYEPDPVAFARFDRDYRILQEMHRHRAELNAIV